MLFSPFDEGEFDFGTSFFEVDLERDAGQSFFSESTINFIQL
jgi:hypothetical protein